jgi:5-methylcytosine-specific restriction endonuclease McrA
MAITQQYKNYLESTKWRAKRLRVLRRDNFVCQKCKKQQATQVHHLTYKRIYNEPLTDLLSVCKDCHEKIHGVKSKKRMSILDIFNSFGKFWESSG